ncbi:PREDICTED: alanine--tRNA ligase, cytoplasmic-like [Rhagoletis zephyria]|uniref:alanine--tRNA ligase, cytoplasmic-like n=1 Tax=Rhagoletis zephyria TaxID=28612 RepID=UPI00081144CB|nr:PREDICTED: alanine--tRNA ligase, cytoplasmic-like [Rhagoletis zephyria]
MAQSKGFKEIRQDFINFFQDKYAHQFVRSSAVIPLDDPTLLFANAGMNQFKPIFLGTVDPNSDMAKWKRAVNSQKCIRAGGKHNDLDDVGKDVYHHTFFEMLGNWSFGDFFKKEICKWSFELLTGVYGLNKDRIYVTYFGGNKAANLDPDEECRQIWVDVGIDPARILPFDMKDNFWEMGETGPCGPCSEIHYDRIGGRDASALVNMDDPDVIEIWNLVFIQFNRENDGSLRQLPSKHVDTGMGFERLVSVIQDKNSNYDTDVFVPLFNAIQEKTGARLYTGKVGADDTDGVDMAYRVVADHARTLTIALSDGGRPDNVGRGYVLRRILRRAIRFIEKLGGKPGALSSLVPVVVGLLGDTFPELNKDPELVMDIINDEEQQFLKTLSRGKRLLERTIEKLTDSKVLPGEIAWKLYDTYGFPFDLTQLMSEEQGLTVDIEGYEKAKVAAQLLSQAKISQLNTTVDLDVHAISELRDQKVPITDDSAKYNYSSLSDKKDSVYRFESCQGTVLAIRKDKAFVQQVTDTELIGLILDATNFYAEQGGQEHDTGFMIKGESGAEVEFQVLQVKVYGGYIMHIGHLIGNSTEGDQALSLKVGDLLRLEINQERRKLIMNNHTGTHVLNYALRAVLNETDQKGSLVAADKLRFDFTCKSAMTSAQIKNAEQIARELIDKNEEVYAKDSPLSAAKAVKGLRAVFDETYPDPVRIVSIGVPVEDLLSDPSSPAGMNTSVEFCGGTHLKRCGHIGDFVITSEEAIAKGIRRILCVTGPEASRSISNLAKLENSVNELKVVIEANKSQFDTLAKELVKKIIELQDEVNKQDISYWKKDELRSSLNSLKKQIDDHERAIKAAQITEVGNVGKQLATEQMGAKFMVEVLNAGWNAKALDIALKNVRTVSPSTAALFFSVDEEAKKIICLSSVPKETKEKGLKANEWINNITALINGKGGGKDESAQAMGSNVSALDEAVKLSREFAALKLGN